MADHLSEVNRVIKDARLRYWVWALAWVTLGLSAITFPALAATPLFDENGSKIMAGIGTTFVGAFAFLQPEKRASEYHTHLFRYRAIHMDLILGTLTEPKEISQRLSEAAPTPAGTFYVGPKNSTAV